MGEQGDFTDISDPASVLVGLGAVCGLVAAFHWLAVFRSVDSSDEAVKGRSGRSVAMAALSTALALGLVSVGYLLGRFTGRF